MAGKWEIAKAGAKKMAKAFGRASTDPGMESKYGRGLIKHGAEPTTSYDLDVTKSGRIVNNNKSFNQDIADAFERGKVEGIIEDTDRMGKGISRDERKRLFDESSDRLTDETMRQDFDDEFNRLIKSNVKENPQRNSFTEDELRKESINMLKGGADISDVFEYLRGNTDYIKVNPAKLKEYTTIRTSPKSAEDADVGIVWDYLADRIDNPEKLDYIMDYHDEFIRQELRNGKSPEDIARTLDTDIFD